MQTVIQIWKSHIGPRFLSARKLVLLWEMLVRTHLSGDQYLSKQKVKITDFQTMCNSIDYALSSVAYDKGSCVKFLGQWEISHNSRICKQPCDDLKPTRQGWQTEIWLSWL